MEDNMRSTDKLGVSGLLVLAAMLSQPQMSAAAEYPEHAVRIIVNVTPGGGVDTTTRIVAQELEKRLGQPFVVENRPSASGNVGAGAVFHATPDGYTLLSSSGSPLAIDGWIYKNLSYEPTGFQPVAVMSRIPNVLVVRSNFPAKTVKEFVEYAKSHPEKLTFASQGAGTASHLTAALFMMLTGTKMVHVPYKGTGPALNDLAGGNVDCSFLPIASTYGLAKAGRVRILAVATDKRVDSLPDVPTLVETGYPEMISSTWNAISAPPNTPTAVLTKLNKSIDEILHEKSVQDRLRGLNMDAVGGSLTETKSVIEKERQQWGKVVHAAKIEAH